MTIDGGSGDSWGSAGITGVSVTSRSGSPAQLGSAATNMSHWRERVCTPSGHVLGPVAQLLCSCNPPPSPQVALLLAALDHAVSIITLTAGPGLHMPTPDQETVISTAGELWKVQLSGPGGPGGAPPAAQSKLGMTHESEGVHGVVGEMERLRVVHNQSASGFCTAKSLLSSGSCEDVMVSMANLGLSGHRQAKDNCGGLFAQLLAQVHHADCLCSA